MITGSQTGKADGKALTAANWNRQREEQSGAGGRLLLPTENAWQCRYMGDLSTEK